jgi:hypothetical protein
MSVKLKNNELLEMILNDLKTIKTDVKTIRQDVSSIKNDIFVIKTIKEVKSETITKPPEPSSGWFF